MSCIRVTVKTLHLLVLLLVCGVGFYSLGVRSQNSPPAPPGDKEDDKSGALTVVSSDEQDDGVVIMDSDGEIEIENPEPFIPTNEWQLVKPGQAIPRGLHVRLNIQTGQREARLMQEENGGPDDNAEGQGNKDVSEGVGDKLNLDEVKRAVKSVKSEKFKSVDMETLKEQQKFRSYEELKEALESMNADIKTDAELITEMMEQFQSVSQTKQDITPLLEQLEYYLHQIDNALLFCDLGGMPLLLHCLNNSIDNVRSMAALALGSALQSNPKVQIIAMENGAMHEVLRLVALDQSMTVRKRALYALSSMVRHFPFAQKRFLELGGLSVLAKLFENKSAENMQVRAVTLLADLIKEKHLHSEHSDPKDTAQGERLRQYQEIGLQEAMVEAGWCSHISSLLVVPEHDSREKVLVAMDTVLPVCRSSFQNSVPVLKSLRKEYADLVLEEQKESQDGESDGFFQGLVVTAEALLDKLSLKEEL